LVNESINDIAKILNIHAGTQTLSYREWRAKNQENLGQSAGFGDGAERGIQIRVNARWEVLAEELLRNASSGFQTRFSPEAVSARLIQEAGVAVSDTESSSFEALIIAGSVMVPTMPTMLPG
jgi:hypothetical protein